MYITQSYVSWSYSLLDNTGFILQRSIDSGSTWPLNLWFSFDTTSYYDNDIQCSLTYSYRIAAVNDCGTGSFSSLTAVGIICITTTTTTTTSTTSTTTPAPCPPPGIPSLTGSQTIIIDEFSTNDSGSFNVGVLFGSVVDVPWTFNSDINVGLNSGSLNDDPPPTSIESIGMSFFTGSLKAVSTPTYSLSPAQTSSIGMSFYTGSLRAVSTPTYSLSPAQTSSIGMSFYTGSLTNVVIQAIAPAQTSSIGVSFYTGSNIIYIVVNAQKEYLDVGGIPNGSPISVGLLSGSLEDQP